MAVDAPRPPYHVLTFLLTGCLPQRPEERGMQIVTERIDGVVISITDLGVEHSDN